MFPRLLVVLGLAAVLGSAIPASGAVIITTRGERIVCEIVRETDTYFVVDHQGYRRYVLKSQVRSLDRGDDGLDHTAGPRRYVEALGGLQVYGHRQASGLGAGRVAIGIPINRTVVLEVNGFVGESDIVSRHEQTEMFSGPLSWKGVTAGAAWQFPNWRVRPLVAAGMGYFLLEHTVAPEDVEFMRSIANWNHMFLDYSEPAKGGLGLQIDFGALMPLNRRVTLVWRNTALVVNGAFTREWWYAPEVNGPEPIRDDQGTVLRMFQSHLGVQFHF